MPAHKSRNGLLAALAAMLLQGLWAMYANYLHGWSAGVRAGAVQGLSSFCMTFCVTLWIEYLLAWSGKLPPTCRLVLTALLAILGMLLVQVGVHWLARTPEIAYTVAPAAGIGSLYCIVYSSGRIFLGKDNQSCFLNQQRGNHE